MSLAHHLRTIGRIPASVAECGFLVHQQQYFRKTLTSQHINAYLTTFSFGSAAHRLSSTITSPNHAIVDSVIKGADARRRSFWKPRRFLATTSFTRTHSPKIIPTSTGAGGVENDRGTSSFLSTCEKFSQALNKKPIIQLPITYKTIDGISPWNNKNEGEPVEQVHKHISNRSHSPGPRKYVAHCGRHYTRQGDKKNHENSCVKCRVMQKQERDRSQSHRGLISWVKDLVASMLETETAHGALDAKHDNQSHTQKRKSQEIDRNTTQLLDVELSRVATSKLTPYDEQGYIYILRDWENGLFKIGFAKDPKLRIKQHNKCGRDLKTVHVSHRIKWAKRAERLVKLDLKHLCRPWFCSSCQQRHGEYFQVTEERAKEIVERWVDWINRCQPYGADGNINPLWNHLIQFSRTPKQAMRNYDHEARWAHWSWMLSSPSEDDLKDLAQLDG